MRLARRHGRPLFALAIFATITLSDIVPTAQPWRGICWALGFALLMLR